MRNKPAPARPAGKKFTWPKRLLMPGNGKLGKNIGAWSIPNVVTCPGRTKLCEKLCYVSRYINMYHLDYYPNYYATLMPGFVERMAAEAQWFRIVRLHVSGDIYSADYARKLRDIAKLCPQTVFYTYTRSWRRPEIRKALAELAALPNFVLIYSADKESGIPNTKRVAYMSLDDADVPGKPVMIVLRVKRKTVKGKLGSSVVCPAENGIKNAVTCQRCQLCFRQSP